MRSWWTCGPPLVDREKFRSGTPHPWWPLLVYAAPAMIDKGTLRALGRKAVVALAACCGLLLLVSPASLADEIDWMYDPDAVVEIHLGGLSEEELDALEPEPDEYQKGTFELTVEGVPKGTLLNDVGVRLKGGTGSARPIKTGKSGLKVRFDEFVKDQLFFGLKRLTLNNMIQDSSMVHETLGYELFRALDLPASRTGYAFVTLNGTDYGLFLNLETLDKISLPHWFASTEHLYEADAAGTDVTPGDVFEVDEGDDEDIADLEALVEAVNGIAGDWSDNVAAVADLEQMTEQWAVERYIAHWDGYAGTTGEFRPNNYYLHSDTAGIFQMMPWGTDQTWERDDIGFDEPAGGIMFNECLADASCADLYLEGLTRVRCVAPTLEQGTHAASLAAMLKPYQDEEEPTRRETSAVEIAAGVESVEDFAALRLAQLEEYLAEQGVFGDEACGSSQPGKPGEPGGPAVAAAAPPGHALSFGPSRLRGSLVATQVTIPVGGAITQRVKARLDGRLLEVCSDRENLDAAGRGTVRCRLSESVREALAEGPLRLRIRVGFAPVAGKPHFVVRALTAPKRA